MEKLEPPHSWVPRVQTERGKVDVDASLFFFLAYFWPLDSTSVLQSDILEATLTQSSSGTASEKMNNND